MARGLELKVAPLGSQPAGVSLLADIADTTALIAVETALLSKGSVAQLADGSQYRFDPTASSGGLIPASGGGRWFLLAPSGGGVNVKAFGATGDGITNDTVAIQAALDSGSDIFFPEGTYLCSGLTLTTAQQTIYGNGGYSTRLVKRANGVILTITGNAVKVRGLTFAGESATPAFTGNNVDVTADEVEFINCNSYRAFARALKLNGGHCLVSGGIYATTDATGSGYDIEVGVSGTARLYTRIINVYSQQATGGILFTDTGSCTVFNSQFGKLTVAAGTSPAGVNGGMYVGNRILGNVAISLATAVFSGNQFGNIAITLALGTSGCSFDLSNSFQAGHTIVNSGNANQVIMRQVSAGSFPTIRYGDDVSYIDVSYDIASKIIKSDSFQIVNNTGAYRILQSNGTLGATLGQTAGGNVELVNLVSNSRTQMSVTGATSLFNWIVNGISKLRADVLGVYLGGTTCFDTQGAGSPEGVVTAPPGSTYRNTSGGAVTSFYVKESGTGNTGWIAK